MKVATKLAIALSIVDALDDKHQFQLQSGGGEGGREGLGPSACNHVDFYD